MNTFNFCESNCRDSLKVAIVGGGVSGLSCAYFLLREAKTRGVRVEPTIFEARSDLGGVVKTVRHGGLVLDMGPECFVSTKPAVGEIARELHFDSRIITQAERRTFIAEASALREVPEGLLSMNPNIPALLMSRLFSSYLQYGPRMPVYLRRLCRRCTRLWCQDEHGWAGTVHGQHICRAALAQSEVRGGVFACV